MSEYNKEQLEALWMVRYYVKDLSVEEVQNLNDLIAPYLDFRKSVSLFQREHLEEICTDKCFTSEASACCNRDGIATFFADTVISCLGSSSDELDLVEYALTNDWGGFKCVYLSSQGCVWKIKPIVCEMFLCDHAKDLLAESDNHLTDEWEKLRQMEKIYTWPDRPVLFDQIEGIFIKAGYDSPLMYLHKSPGLLRVKALSSRVPPESLKKMS